jgi:mono/diheme cytochrome c family protein
MKRLTLIFLSLVLLETTNVVYAQPDGEALFNDVCAVCHKLNQGKFIGPDLVNVHQKRSEAWLLKFIASSQKMILSGDPDAVAIFDEFNQLQMPDAPYNEEEIKAILAYIAQESPELIVSETVGTTGSEAEETLVESEPLRSVDDATEDEIVLGRMLFTGEKRLEGAGPSCISCHHVKNDRIIGGGLLAKDLTGVFTRLNETGIKAMLSAPPFPVMKEAYSRGPVTDDEAYYVTAFLKYADREQYGQHTRNYQHRFLATGVTGLFVLLGIFSFIWRNRRKRKVNHRIYSRQISSESSLY